MTRKRLSTSSCASTAEGSSMTISRASWRERARHADDLLARGGEPADLAGRRDLGVAEPGEQRARGLGVRPPRRVKPAARLLVAEEDVLGDATARRPGRAPGRSWRCRGACAAIGVDSGPARPARGSSPSSGWWAPASTLIRVDLPAPFWPSRQCTSPGATSRSTPSSARTPGNSLTMPAHRAGAAARLVGRRSWRVVGAARSREISRARR